MWCIIAVFVAIILFETSMNECACPCTWQSNGAILDLSAFVEMPIEIEGADSFGTKYRYSPCTNQYYNDESSYFGYPRSMVVVGNSYVSGYAIFPGNTYQNPAVYDPNNRVWTFEYSKGYANFGGCGYNVKSNILWICNESLTEYPYYNFIGVKEIIPCTFQIEIESYYACNKIIEPSPMETIQKKQCVWNYQGYTLNLTDIYGLTLGYDKCVGTCTYSVCTDNAPVVNPLSDWSYQCGMIVNGNPATSVYAFWDPEVEPVFNYDNETWTFQYRDPYKEYYGNNAMIHWFCGPEPYKVESVVATNTGSNWWRIWNISSSYACIGKQRFCVFTDGTNQLNLATIAGTSIYWTDDDEIYSYIYTPCSNEVTCNTNNIMSIKWNIDERTCEQYLAVWQDDYTDIRYIGGSNKLWQFDYHNGEMCQNGTNAKFTVYWECNPSVNDWKVIKVEEINECGYEMTVQSVLVC